MEATLYRLFDFQKYEQNQALGAVIDAVHAQAEGWRALDEDSLQVWAAGEAEPQGPRQPELPHDQG